MSQTATTPALPPVPRWQATHDEATARRIECAWAALLPRADAIADAISATIFARDPDWYAKADDRLRADVRQNTREHIRSGLQALAGRKTSGTRTTDVWRETGRRRARQRVQLELVLNSYTLGARLLWEAMLELAGSGHPDIDDQVLVVAGQQLWHNLDVQNAVLIDAYRRESARRERRDLQRQQGYLDGLVDGRGADHGFATESAAALGISADEPVACVVAPFDGPLDEPLTTPDDRLERTGRTSHWHVRGGHLFGLVPMGGLGTAQLAEILRPAATGRVGVASSPEGIGGFATAYQLAARAAQTVPRGRTAVVLVDDRLPEVLLAGSPEVTALLVERSVAPLLAQSPHQARVLLDTLAVLLDCNVSPSRAAEQLYCHRNTVIYRLKQIEQLTGRDLHDPRQRLLLTLGLTAIGHTGPDRPAPAAGR
ncbi:PucR family transcriptional regulator [Nocardioides sp. CPCC 205120]|uniref:PucR family transcriptional regulator n=1 Tax=Nocardioides sp. CPCC 205120 TaxID=3406462 RepID=UPI003B509736